MRKLALLVPGVLLAGSLAAGCVLLPGPVPYGGPEKWRGAAVLLTTAFSCWLTHRLLDRLKGPGADDPPFPHWPRSPWYLPPFFWEYTFSSGLSATKWVLGGAWLMLWMWVFGLI
jgi:hypothetical protein